MFGGRFWRQLAGLAGEMVLEQANGGQMAPQMVLLGGGPGSEQGTTERAGPTYARFIRLFTIY